MRNCAGNSGLVRLIRIAESAFAAMIEEADRRLPNETGGILVGWIEGDRAEVTLVVGPGPRATHCPAFFRRDGKFSQELLEAAYKRSSGRCDYLGEWHSHPLPAGPSPRDRKSMRVIAQSRAFDLEHPLLVICERSRRRSWQPSAYQWNERRLLRLPVVMGPDSD